MSWNAQDQLTHLQTPQLTASFTYDPLGRRVSFSKGAFSKSYFYNGLDMLSDGSSRYLHGAGIDEPLEIQPAGTAPAQSYLQDHLGSTTRLLHAAIGQDTARYDYTSYGDLEGNASNPSLMNPYTYTGREDDGTGLMYYRARYYDPELEVFISQDPLGDAMRYVGGNPMGFVDPLGLAPDINLFAMDDKLRERANQSIPDSPGSITIAGHGGKGGLYAKGSLMPFDDIVSMITNLPEYQRAKQLGLQLPIVLYACDTGNTENGVDAAFAQKLAKALNTPVIAPSNWIYWNDKSQIFGIYEPLGPPLAGLPNLFKPGQFNGFTPW